jgi:S-adenosylmethionine decarboxylase proenzyme
MQGLHLTADLYDCQCERSLMVDASVLAPQAHASTRAAGLSVVGEVWHGFELSEQSGGGITGVLLLAESHTAIHTWPEKNCVTLDVYVCNFGQDNSAKAEQLLAALIALFVPQRVVANRLQRGLENQD